MRSPVFSGMHSPAAKKRFDKTCGGIVQSHKFVPGGVNHS